MNDPSLEIQSLSKKAFEVIFNSQEKKKKAFNLGREAYMVNLVFHMGRVPYKIMKDNASLNHA